MIILKTWNNHKIKQNQIFGETPLSLRRQRAPTRSGTRHLNSKYRKDERKTVLTHRLRLKCA